MTHEPSRAAFLSLSLRPMSTEKADPPKATASRRRFVGRAVTADDVAGTNNASDGKAATSAAAAAAAPTSVNAVPKEITEDAFLNAAIEALLPSNYSFEVHKSIWQIRKHGITRVALQVSVSHPRSCPSRRKHR